MSNFWDFNVWDWMILFAVLLGSLLVGNILKKTIPFLKNFRRFILRYFLHILYLDKIQNMFYNT